MRKQSMKRIAAAAMAFAMVCGCVQAAPAGKAPLWGISAAAADMTDAEKLADAVKKVESGNFGYLHNYGYEETYYYTFNDMPLSSVDQYAANAKADFIGNYLSPAFDGTGVTYSVDLTFSNTVNKPESAFAANERLADYTMVITLNCAGNSETVTKTGSAKRTAAYISYKKYVPVALEEYKSEVMMSSYTNDITEEELTAELDGFKDYFMSKYGTANQCEIFWTFCYDFKKTPATAAADGSVSIEYYIGLADKSANWVSYSTNEFFEMPLKTEVSKDDKNKQILNEYAAKADEFIGKYYGTSYPSNLDDGYILQNIMEIVDGSGIKVDVTSSDTKTGNTRTAEVTCVLTLDKVSRTVNKQWTKYVSTPTNEAAAAILESMSRSLSNYYTYSGDTAEQLKENIEYQILNYSTYESGSFSYPVKDYGITYNVNVVSYEPVENSGLEGETKAKYSASVTLTEPVTGETVTFSINDEIKIPVIPEWYRTIVTPFVNNYIAGIEVNNDTSRYSLNIELKKMTEALNALGGDDFVVYNTPMIYTGSDEYFTLIPSTAESEGSLKAEFGVGVNTTNWTENYWDSFTIEKTIPKLPAADEPDEPVKPDEPGTVTAEEPVIAPGAPDTGVSMPAGSTAADMVELTAEEKAAVDSGADLKLVLNVAPLTPDAATEAAVEQAAAGMTVGLYLDLSVMAQIEGSNSSREVNSLKKAMTITVELPASLTKGIPEGFEREYYIIHAGDNGVQKCGFDSITGKITFRADAFSPYAIAYVDVEKAVEPEPAPAPAVYNVNVTGGNAVVTGSRTAGSVMTVTVPVGYEAVVTSGSDRLAVITDGTGTFTMPAADVTVRVDLSITAYSMVHYPNSYIFCYDSDMNHIRTNSSRYGINGTGDITVKLGADYAGRSVTLYSGRKSTASKVDEGVLDSSGRITFNVQGGKNFTLIVE